MPNWTGVAKSNWNQPLANMVSIPAMWKNMAENRGRLRAADIKKELLSDLISLSLNSFSLSKSLSTSSSALYPAFSTVFIRSNSSIEPEGYSITALLVVRFTLALTTPSILLRAFSTLAEQAAQVMPSTRRTFFTRGTS